MAIPALPRRPLGQTEILATPVGIGGWLGMLDNPQATPVQRQAAGIAAVRRAVELGITYFDTSPSYGGGQAQRHLGLGLKSLSQSERAPLCISTKVGTHQNWPQQYDADSVRRCFDDNLKHLFAERVDILFVHDPSTDAHMDQIMGPGGALETLESFKETGVIGAIGLGVRTHHFLNRAIDSGRFDAILPSYDYHPGRTSVEPVLKKARQQGMFAVNGSPYNAGLLAGLDPDVAVQRRGQPKADVDRARKLWQWCQLRNLDMGTIAMQYSLRCPLIGATLAGPRTASEVEGNFQHATTKVPESTWEDLEVFIATLGDAPVGGESR